MMNVMLVQCLPNNELYDTRYQSENLALGYLAAALRKDHIPTEILDAHLNMIHHKQTVEMILEANPRILGISASAQDSISSTFNVVKLLRETGYQGHIIVGGHFPTYESEKVLQHSSGIDSVCRGEGEQTIVELVRALEQGHSLSEVQGITYRNEQNEIIVNPPRPLVDDLDVLALPDRDTLDILLEKNRRVSLLTSRGCYAKCSFCSIQTFFDWRPRRVRSIDNVIEEIKLLYAKGVRKFKIVDDLFMDPSAKSQRWVKEFCARIRAEKLDDLNLWLQVRAVCVNEEIFRELLSIGLRKVFLGLESGHADTLKRYRKEITPEQNEEAVRILKKVGVPEISIGMMIFEPYVSLHGIKENVEFLKRLGTFDIRDVTGRFLPYAGTPMTAQLAEEGKIRRRTWYDVGSYDFEDQKVAKLYKMVRAYNRHAKKSLKLIYKLDGHLRKLEKYFMKETADVTYMDQYQVIRRDIEGFSSDHGDLMLGLVEETIHELETGFEFIDEKIWFQKSRELFRKAEQDTEPFFHRFNKLFQAMNIPFDETQPSIHVADVKVLTRKR